MEDDDSTHKFIDDLIYRDAKCYCRHIGYRSKKPGGCFYGMTAKMMSLLERNDPTLHGLIVDGRDWIKGSGRLFGESTGLYTLRIEDGTGTADRSWLDELCRGITHNRSIESFSLTSWCKSDTDIFGILFPFLQYNSSLRYIHVSLEHLGSFATSLSQCQNGQLEYINVISRGSTEAEAVALFRSLNEQPKLTDLSIRMYRSHAIIDVHCITILKNALNKHNSVLKLTMRLDLSKEGWKIFASILSHPVCSILKLEIEAKRVNVIHLARAMAANNSLRHLSITGVRSPKTSENCWGILHRALCDVSSINKTFSSNHTLHELVVSQELSLQEEIYDDKPLPNDISSLLDMNKIEDKAQVARKKILKYHFTEEGKDVHVFARMPLPTMPVAIEWISRDQNEFSLMYEVLRSVPALFERLASNVET